MNADLIIVFEDSPGAQTWADKFVLRAACSVTTGELQWDKLWFVVTLRLKSVNTEPLQRLFFIPTPAAETD